MHKKTVINSFPMTNPRLFSAKENIARCGIKILESRLRSENKQAACLNIHLAKICRNMTMELAQVGKYEISVIFRFYVSENHICMFLTGPLNHNTAI